MENYEGEIFEYVGFWLRVLMYIIDSLILFAGVNLLLLLVPLLFWMAPAELQFLLSFLVAVVFPVAAIILFWVYKQATPGKMLFGVKIVDADTGGPPSVGQCIGRYLGYIVSGVLFLLGFIWVAFDSRKQGFHDKLAGTLVVQKL